MTRLTAEHRYSEIEVGHSAFNRVLHCTTAADADTRPGNIEPEQMVDQNLVGTEAPLTIEIFGPLRVLWQPNASRTVEITSTLQPRCRELLALLAIHPNGVTRDLLVDALWGKRCPRRPSNALTMTLNRLRTAITTATDGEAGEIMADSRTRCRLDSTVVTVDYWDFSAAIAARRRATTDAERLVAYRRIIDTAGGPLAADVAADWIDPIREAARRDVINAHTALARLLVDHDPRQALDLLEAAVDDDPYNELLWCDILRLHVRLGEHDAIERTMTLLTRRLAEIGEKPTRDTKELAEYLRRQKR